MLDQNKLLSEENALLIYKDYLCTPRENFKKEMMKPCRTKTFKGMVKGHKENIASKMIQEHIDAGKRVLFWSDQHFFHNNIIVYSDRDFIDMEHMNAKMVQNYKNIVTNDDLVIFGGDLSFASLEKTENLLKDLPGKKILIIGNHDLDKKYGLINYHIFDAVSMIAVYNKNINDTIANILVTHYPIDNALLPHNTVNVHGHIHQYKADRKNINISVEHLNYMPQNIDKEIEQTFMENYT